MRIAEKPKGSRGPAPRPPRSRRLVPRPLRGCTEDQFLDWIRLNAMNFAQLLYAALVHPEPLPGVRNTRDQVQRYIDEAGIRASIELTGLSSLLTLLK